MGFTKQYMAHYTMFHYEPTPAGFTNVHLTVSSDNANIAQSYDENGKLISKLNNVWKLPHVTFQWREGLQQRNFHVFLKPAGAGYVKINSQNKTFSNVTPRIKGMLDIADQIIKDKKISDVLFSPEEHVRSVPSAIREAL